LQLVPFPDSPDAEKDLRDLALAWEFLANSCVEPARPEAGRLLRRSAAEFPNDAPTLAALCYENQIQGNIPEARNLYRRAVASDPDLIDAVTNLAVIEAQDGHPDEAIGLLQTPLDEHPEGARPE
jgi:tetratricopeptide (TPR) repeat protein